MKWVNKFVFSALCAGILFLSSCDRSWKGDCVIRLSFSKEYNILVNELTTKGESYSMPDTNDFILSIKDENGESVFSGKYGKKPDKLAVAEGLYIIEVFSSDFEEPAFDLPLFGDSCAVTVSSGSTTNVSFKCRQLNSGMRVYCSDEFKKQFSSSVVVLKKGDLQIEYSYNEDRIAYFNPGKVELRIVSDDVNRKILSRNLERSQILTINLSIAAQEMGDADFHIVVDTGRVWISEKYEYGTENDGSVKGKAFSVEEAIEMVGEVDVWVKGYIVGGDMTSASICYTVPFTSATHLAIASDINVRERGRIIAVELKIGDIRDSLNLVNNPANLHRFVYLRGNIVDSYFGVRGMKSLKEYAFE